MRPWVGLPGRYGGILLTYAVTIETVAPHPIAAFRARVRIPEIANVWKPALDQVWAFLRAHPEALPGHNVFLYHHAPRREDPMDIDFGVAVRAPLIPEAPLLLTATPSGEVATTLHVGPYAGLKGAHDAIHAWCAANGRQIGPASWEIYGDWSEDETKLETRVVYLLR